MNETTVFHFEEAAHAPIACDMTTATDSLEERMAEYGRLFAHALIDRRRDGDAVVFTFAAKLGVAAWAADLARREAACCPFFSYDVAVDGDRVVWRTSSGAGPVAQEFLDEFHGLPDRMSDGLDGMLARLADRGITIVSPAPGRLAIDERKSTPGLLGRVKSACGC
jgi:hypothetical protein